MKNVRMGLLVAFVISVNVFTLPFVFIFISEVEFPPILAQIQMIALLFSFVLAIACIVFALATHKKSSLDPSLQKGLGIPIIIFKVLMIPYFIVTFMLAVLYLLAGAVATLSVWFMVAGLSIGMGALILFPLMTVLNYLLIMATSSFSISAIVIEYRKNIIKAWQLVIFIALQALPLTDVISYPFIVAYLKGQNKQRARTGVFDEPALQVPLSGGIQ